MTAQNVWHSVDDSLPELGKRVLICGKTDWEPETFVCVARTFNAKAWWANGKAYHQGEVTHWAEFTDPPKTT